VGRPYRVGVRGRRLDRPGARCAAGWHRDVAGDRCWRVCVVQGRVPRGATCGESDHSGRVSPAGRAGAGGGADRGAGTCGGAAGAARAGARRRAGVGCRQPRPLRDGRHLRRAPCRAGRAVQRSAHPSRGSRAADRTSEAGRHPGGQVGCAGRAVARSRPGDVQVGEARTRRSDRPYAQHRTGQARRHTAHGRCRPAVGESAEVPGSERHRRGGQHGDVQAADAQAGDGHGDQADAAVPGRPAGAGGTARQRRGPQQHPRQTGDGSARGSAAASVQRADRARRHHRRERTPLPGEPGAERRSRQLGR
jgi:hypothetical protein